MQIRISRTQNSDAKQGHDMKITNIKLRKVSGTMETDGTFWEERLGMPLDVYPEYRSGGTHGDANQLDDNHYRIVAAFVQIETDEGVI